MRPAWVILTTTLRRVARDRSSLFFMVLFPVALVLVIGLAMGGVMGPEPVGLVRPDTPMAAQLHDILERSSGRRVVRFAEPEAMRRAVRRDVVAGGVVLRDDYDEALRHARAVAEVVANPWAAEVRAAVDAALAEHGSLVQSARFATERGGGTFDANLAAAAQVQDVVSVAPEIVAERRGARLPRGFAYTAPSQLVLFVFITGLASAAIMIEQRRLGIWARVLSTPASARALVAGETAARFVVALAQALIVIAAGRLLFGVDWGDPLAAAALVVVYALVAAAAGLLAATTLTAEQAGTLAPVLGIAMGMLGGAMWPLEVVPPVMRTVGHLFPQAWAMGGFIELIGARAGIRDVVPNLVALALFAGVLLPLGVVRLRRAVVS